MTDNTPPEVAELEETGSPFSLDEYSVIALERIATALEKLLLLYAFTRVREGDTESTAYRIIEPVLRYHREQGFMVGPEEEPDEQPA